MFHPPLHSFFAGRPLPSAAGPPTQSQRPRWPRPSPRGRWPWRDSAGNKECLGLDDPVQSDSTQEDCIAQLVTVGASDQTTRTGRQLGPHLLSLLRGLWRKGREIRAEELRVTVHIGERLPDDSRLVQVSLHCHEHV